jgi:hypothetical protein
LEEGIKGEFFNISPLAFRWERARERGSQLKGLYIHIPFCVRKCSYCDFYSLPNRQPSIADYIRALLLEAASFPLSQRGISAISLLAKEGLRENCNPGLILLLSPRLPAANFSPARRERVE